MRVCDETASERDPVRATAAVDLPFTHTCIYLLAASYNRGLASTVVASSRGLASTAASYNNSPSTLSKWVNDLLIKAAKENWGYQLQLSLLDTKVRIIVQSCKVSVLYARVHFRLIYLSGFI